jgi:hypothetical protein
MAILLAATGGDVGQFALQNVATGYCNRMTAAQPGEIAAEGNAHRVLKRARQLTNGADQACQ